VYLGFERIEDVASGGRRIAEGRGRLGEAWSRDAGRGGERRAQINNSEVSRIAHAAHLACRRCQPCHREKLPLLKFYDHHVHNLIPSSPSKTPYPAMKLSNQSSVPVYTIAGSNTSRPLPDWLVRKRKRSLKQDTEFANRVELLQDFEFEEASSCVRVSEDGDWVMSTGTNNAHF
jgi:hypothetical protein